MIELEPGSQFEGRYEIVRQLGAGGMGAVYLARLADNPQQFVAIKVLYPGRLTNKESRERFRNEVTATFQVQHENVVSGYQYIDQDDFQAYVMEYVEGGDLLDRMKGQKLSVPQVVRYLKQIAAGLAAVHKAGIVHRDLKPDNMLYDEAGDLLKLHDFGVARLEGANPLTLVGTMVGTPKYLSPEYVETGSCDHRGDIYATGIIGFEMITGQSPFRSVSKVSLMVERLKTRIPPLRESCRECPEGLGRIIDKAIAVKVNERYQTADELYKALDAFERTLSQPKPEAVVPAKEPTVLTGRPISTGLERQPVAAQLFAMFCFWALLSLALVGGVAIGGTVAAKTTGADLHKMEPFAAIFQSNLIK